MLIFQIAIGVFLGLALKQIAEALVGLLGLTLKMIFPKTEKFNVYSEDDMPHTPLTLRHLFERQPKQRSS